MSSDKALYFATPPTVGGIFYAGRFCPWTADRVAVRVRRLRCQYQTGGLASAAKVERGNGVGGIHNTHRPAPVLGQCVRVVVLLHHTGRIVCFQHLRDSV